MERPLCAITSSSHSVPGSQLSFQPGTAGNDRISMVPLERWDVELAPADNPAGGQCSAATAPLSWAASQHAVPARASSLELRTHTEHAYHTDLTFAADLLHPASHLVVLHPRVPPAELNQQFGSFLAGADLFDAAALGVSPAEALLMDPQQRLVMQSFSGEWTEWTEWTARPASNCLRRGNLAAHRGNTHRF